MKSIVCIAALSAVIFTGCTPHYREVGPYHEDGTEKPRTVLLPVADYSLATLPWSLSDEFYSGVKEQLVRHAEVFVCPDPVGYAVPAGLDGIDLVDRHSQELKQRFDDADFVVLMELIDHSEVPINRDTMKLEIVDGGNATHVIQMKMRIQAVDLRGGTAKPVLRETIEKTYPIFSAAVFDVQKAPWGTGKYQFSVLGRAHIAMEKEIAQRLEQYLLLAKGREPS
jgi:hypothetical protein